MEFAEVVNPHFAVPVVGVVLCAVLVFAFGFKSPVQPPSFDFDDHEDRKNKRPKKSKQRAPSNGHVVNVDSHNVASVSKQPASPKQSPGSKAIAEKNEPALKSKVKKTGNAPKPTAKPATTPEVRPAKDEDDGGWTVAVARKDKKRGKKDEGPIPAKAEPKKEEALPATVEPITTHVIVADPPEPVAPEPSKPQRAKKEKKQKETPVTVEKIVDIPQSDLSDKENTPEIEIPPAEPVTILKPQADAMDKAVKTSPKKKKNKKPKSGGELEGSSNKEAVEPEATLGGGGEAHTAAVDKKEMPKETPVVLEEPVLKSDVTKLAAGPVQPTPAEAKPARSPKKKKKNKTHEPASPENSGAGSVAETATISPSSLDLGANSSAESALSQQSSKGAAKDRLSESVSEPSPAPSSTMSSSPQIATQENKQSTEKVTFDELGEWQEARTVKKKKKARRDN